ncbi:MAG: tyrosine-type recombinase/integrase [Acidobacteriota bacterium]
MAKRRGHNEGSIFQRKDGRWASDIALGYENGKRKRQTLYGSTRKEVHEKLTECLHKKQQGEVIPTGKQTVGEFLGEWLADCVKPSLRPRSYGSYEEMVRLHIKPALGEVRLTKLTGQRVQSFLNQLANKDSATVKGQKLSPRTVAYCRTILRMALNVAVEWRLIAHNPAAIRLRLASVEPRKVEPLTAEQRQALMKAIEDDRLSALFLTMLLVGLRRGEALGLHWRDVDLDARKLRVNTTLQRINKELVLGSPKTEKSQRDLTIEERAVAALREHRKRQLEERMAAGPVWHDTGLVFTTVVGSPIDPRNVKRVLDRLLKKAKLPHSRLHDLRHEFASNMLACGIDLKVVSDCLGHSKLAITADTYAHVSQDLIREAMDKAGAR